MSAFSDFHTSTIDGLSSHLIVDELLKHYSVSAVHSVLVSIKDKSVALSDEVINLFPSIDMIEPNFDIIKKFLNINKLSNMIVPTDWYPPYKNKAQAAIVRWKPERVEIFLKSVGMGHYLKVVRSASFQYKWTSCFTYSIVMLRLFNNSYYNYLLDEGYLFNEETILFDAFKKISSYLKTSVYSKDMNFLIELHNIRGYQTLPDPNFDIDAAFNNYQNDENLSHIPENLYVSSLLEVINQGKGLAENETFESYVASGVWATSGASPGKKINAINQKKQTMETTNIQKNYLYWSFDVNTLVDGATKAVLIQSKTAVKEETGKSRLFFPTDTDSYLPITYSMAAFIDIYSTIKFTNYRETPEQFVEFIDTCNAGYMFSFDFPSFDTSISVFYQTLIMKRWEMLCVHKRMWEKSRMLVENTEMALGTKTFVNKFALISGLALTSAIGSAHNANFGNIIDRCVLLLGGDRSFRRVQGDDSISVTTAAVAALTFMLCTVFEQKFEVNKCYGGVQGEFLRRRITNEGVFGYVGRAITGLFLFKPWSNDRDTTVQVSNLFDVFRTCCRRVFIGLVQCEEWLKKIGATLVDIVPEVYIACPKRVGGLGLLVTDWKGKTKIETDVQLDSGSLIFQQSSDAAVEAMKKKVNINTVLDSSSIMQHILNKNMNSNMMSKLSVHKRRVLTYKRIGGQLSSRRLKLIIIPDYRLSDISNLSDFNVMYPKESLYSSQIHAQTYNEIASVLNLGGANLPRLSIGIVSKSWPRWLSDAVLLGEGFSLGRLHPQASFMVDQVVVSILINALRYFPNLSNYNCHTLIVDLAITVENLLSMSPFYKRYYLW